MNLGKFGEIWGRNFGESQNLGKSPKFQKKRGISLRAGWNMAGPSVAGSVVPCDTSQNRDQVNHRRMGRDWDVLGKSESA